MCSLRCAHTLFCRTCCAQAHNYSGVNYMNLCLEQTSKVSKMFDPFLIYMCFALISIRTFNKFLYCAIWRFNHQQCPSGIWRLYNAASTFHRHRCDVVSAGSITNSAQRAYDVYTTSHQRCIHVDARLTQGCMPAKYKHFRYKIYTWQKKLGIFLFLSEMYNRY